jgi:hypothetical protein
LAEEIGEKMAFLLKTVFLPKFLDLLRKNGKGVDKIAQNVHSTTP